jgi:hypothetical protein
MITSKVGSKLFEDPELETELHNKLSSQLRNPEVAKSFVRACEWKSDAWTKSWCYTGEKAPTPQEEEDLRLLVDAKLAEFDLKAPGILKVEIASQVPVTSYNSSLIGYVDIQYNVQMVYKTLVTLNSFVTAECIATNTSWPAAPMNQDGCKIFYIQIENHTRYVDRVIREINTLKTYLSGFIGFAVYSPDKSAVADLAGSKIRLISPQDAGVAI